MLNDTTTRTHCHYYQKDETLVATNHEVRLICGRNNITYSSTGDGRVENLTEIGFIVDVWQTTQARSGVAEEETSRQVAKVCPKMHPTCLVVAIRDFSKSCDWSIDLKRLQASQYTYPTFYSKYYASCSFLSAIK